MEKRIEKRTTEAEVYVAVDGRVFDTERDCVLHETKLEKEKMRDFKTLSKEEFLKSYSYLTEAEYDNTMKIYITQEGKSND